MFKSHNCCLFTFSIPTVYIQLDLYPFPGINTQPGLQQDHYQVYTAVYLRALNIRSP